MSTQPGQEVADFITDLDGAAISGSPTPRIDNPLKIATDGGTSPWTPAWLTSGPPERRAGQRCRPRDPADPRLLQGQPLPRRVRRPAPHPRRPPGPVSDRGTPKSDSDTFTFYAALRDELVVGGTDPATIRFIHDARTAAERLQLQADARTGDVAVLMGSTEKMGTGTNVQTRLIALHHVDVPWRLADLEQREGDHPPRQPEPGGGGPQLRRRRHLRHGDVAESGKQGTVHPADQTQ